VYNLPRDQTANALKELFGKFGKVISADVKIPDKCEEFPQEMQLIKPQNIGKSLVGYVMFQSPTDASKAI